VETLAAMLFMAIVMPVAIQGLLLASEMGSTAKMKRQAALLADQVLAEAVATESWRSGDETGDFGEDWPGFAWELTSEAWSEDTMRLVTVRVDCTVRGEPRSEQLSTLALDEEAVEETEEAE